MIHNTLLLLLLPLISLQQIKNSVEISGSELQNNPVLFQDDPLERLKFLRQPEDKTVNQDDSVYLYCVVDAIQGVNYQYKWYKNDDFSRGMLMTDDYLISGVDGPKLHISEAQSHHTGQYLCTVTIVGTDITIISSSGKLTVNFYTQEETVERTISAQENQNYVQLLCDVPASNPPAQVVWYKLRDKIADDPRMFVLPEDSNFDKDLKRGSLVIMYVKSEDEGRYFCKTTYDGVEYTLTNFFFDVDGSVQTSPYINSLIMSEVAGKSKLGGRAEFYCAGIGKPAPVISWQKQDGSRIETSEHFMLEDNKRRLVITNVNEDDDDNSYTCTLTVAHLPEKKKILYLTILPSMTEIKFVTAPVSHVIYTNRYPPFSLQCAIDYAAFIDLDGNLKPVLYWLKDGKQLQVSKRMSSITEENSGSKILQSTIEFVTPNESDLGLYQCIAQSNLQIRQTTAHVNVRRSSQDYDLDSIRQKYTVFDIPMTVSAAEEYCKSWTSNGHLVSIMTRQEVDTIVSLLENEGIQQAWIGLTSEDVRKPGQWQWTQPADNSRVFSYWHEDSPDNLYGREHYAIMDTSLGGRWLDVKNKGKYPFVCKQYESTCPSIVEYFEGKVEPLNKAENSKTRYGVGEAITVTCADRTVALKETLTCTTRETFEPEGIACPTYDNSSQGLTSSVLLVLLLILLLS